MLMPEIRKGAGASGQPLPMAPYPQASLEGQEAVPGQTSQAGVSQSLGRGAGQQGGCGETDPGRDKQLQGEMETL